MNKIVRMRYPVERLPADLRPEAATIGEVLVTVEFPDKTPVTAAEWLSMVRNRAPLMPSSDEDPVARIRKLRDEWDD